MLAHEGIEELEAVRERQQHDTAAKHQQQVLEDYLILLLSDSALPTGGFVASSGLESFVQHGLIATTSTLAKNAIAIPPFNLQSFLKESLSSYAQLNLSFFARAHVAVWKLREHDAANLDATVSQLVAIDAELEAMLLNHVARRASKAQGIALLTLYSRAFALPLPSKDSEDEIQLRIDALMEVLKTSARGRNATLHGHLPTCFAVMCAALGLSLDRSRHLHLFLQARAILSSAVRLNLVGPYAAQKLLLQDVRNTVVNVLGEQSQYSKHYVPHANEPSTKGNDGDGPATTWPLGEILAARHDLLHSRIFNS